MVPHGDINIKQKLSGGIAILRDSSPYLVLEECRIKTDNCAFIWSKTSYLAVQQLTGFITFQGEEYVRLKQENKKQEKWVEKIEYIQEIPSLSRGNTKSQSF